MKKVFEPKQIEKKWYSFWEKNNLFSPKVSSNKKTYSIMIPPPNVTGSLHMGHGFQNTLMDVLSRYKRLKGFEVLWQPGIDHAGIATQLVVERNLEQKGLSREKIGRSRFEKEVWKWKSKSGNIISSQLKRLGASLDWNREKFTMDDDFSEAVTEVFCSLYDEGLIYRGYRLVNWDVSLKTAISDLEVLSEEENAKIWHITYKNKERSIVVATTRPETMFGDVAIAVNPNDKRYIDLIGETFEIPISGKSIKIISDNYVDKDFGTGCLKITPAHDFNDFEIGKRHQLPMVNILDKNGLLNKNVPKKYQNLTPIEARKILLTDLKNIGALVKELDHRHNVPRSERTGEILEPMLTKQWYLKSKNLSKEAIKLVRDKKIKFIPSNWEKTYFSWMKDIRDWCISRQLWWGHRIPAWYDDKGKVYVGASEKKVRTKYKLNNSIKLEQDTDVLDTWFSSQLWTFVTLGWPKKTKHLKKFHPSSVLVTGFDIIFFWVARMIMISQKFLKEVPFKEVYIHGLVRDSEGEKMSKSKGNILDPIDIIDGINLKDLINKRTTNLINPNQKQKIVARTSKDYPNGIPSYGTDAIRFTFCSLASGSRDLNFDLKRVEGYRNFCNKLWNASRFILLQCDQKNLSKNSSKSMEDIWIQKELDKALNSYTTHIENYRFDLATQVIYEFVWEKYCDWYIEFCKVRLQNKSLSKIEKSQILTSLVNTLESILIALHPIIPFVTEEIWQQLKKYHKLKVKSISLRKFPKTKGSKKNFDDINLIKSTIVGIRNFRSEMKLSPKIEIELIMDKRNKNFKILEIYKVYLEQLCGVSNIAYASNPPPSSIILVPGDKIFIPLKGLINPNLEITRNSESLNKLNKSLVLLQDQLGNEKFLNNAPKLLIKERKTQLKEIKTKISETKKHLKVLKEV
tara:strand:+ start:37 stop:2772 length:2736 start_codon:yes stop_codon:yes gene_type:complete